MVKVLRPNDRQALSCKWNICIALHPVRLREETEVEGMWKPKGGEEQCSMLVSWHDTSLELIMYVSTLPAQDLSKTGPTCCGRKGDHGDPPL